MQQSEINQMNAKKGNETEWMQPKECNQMNAI